MKKLLIFTILISCSLSLFASQQLEISPLRLELRIPPEGEYAGEYSVKNITDSDMEVAIEVNDWFVLEDNKGIEAKDWLSFDPPVFNLKSNEVRVVKYKIKVPKEAKGELAEKISFTPTISEAQLIVMMSVSLYVFIEGTEEPIVEIAKSVVRREKDGYTAAVVLKNEGNVHIRPTGKVTVLKGKKVVKTVPISYGWPVYPNQERAFFARWDDMLLDKGRYTAKFEVNLLHKGMVLKDSCRFKIDENGEVVK
ncbi:MAG: hypothetical protein ABII27_04605 [bacterium]